MRRGGNESGGFTIVETLIVLAVSAMLAISAMLAVSGRQTKTDFMVGANNTKQKIEEIINETRSGAYVGDGFSCTAATSAWVRPQITTGSPQLQGTNNDCVFVGKAVQFGVPDNTTGSTYPLVGRRQVLASGVLQEVSGYFNPSGTGANPVALDMPAIGVDRSESFQLGNGLQFIRAKYNLAGGGAPTASYAVFALADDLSGYGLNATTGDLNSATEKLNLYYFSMTPPSATPVWPGSPTSVTDVANKINSANANINDTGTALNSLELCFQGGVSGQFAVITINGLGQLSVKLKIQTTC